MGIPVVIIRGILESGKTTFLIDAIKKGDFGNLGRTLVLAQEEGEIEYDLAELKKHSAVVEYVDEENWNSKYINELVRKHKPHVIFIEKNEMWEEKEQISYFDLQQTMTIIDGVTFNQYFNNMRQKFVDMIMDSEIVIINRCKATPETSNFKRSVKIINKNVAVLALDENGLELKLESDLPYSLKEEIINIKLEDFGTFYIDTFDSQPRYENRMVELDCMAVFDRKLPKKTFVAGRLAMTCCADDIQFLGHLCAYKQDINLKNKSWIHLKAIIHYMNIKGQVQAVFQAIEITPIPSPSEEDALVSLV